MKKSVWTLIIEYFNYKDEIDLNFIFSFGINKKALFMTQVDLKNGEKLKKDYNEFLVSNNIPQVKLSLVLVYSSNLFNYAVLSPKSIFKKKDNIYNSLTDVFGKDYKRDYSTTEIKNRINKYNDNNLIYLLNKIDLKNIKTIGYFLKLRVSAISIRPLALINSYQGIVGNSNSILIEEGSSYFYFLVFISGLLVDSYFIFKKDIDGDVSHAIYSTIISLKEGKHLVNDDKEINKVYFVSKNEDLFKQISFINVLGLELIERFDEANYSRIKNLKTFRLSQLIKGDTLLEVVVALAVFSLALGTVFTIVGKLEKSNYYANDYRKVNNYIGNVASEYSVKTTDSLLLPPSFDGEEYYLTSNLVYTDTLDDYAYRVLYDFNEITALYCLKDTLTITKITNLSSYNTYEINMDFVKVSQK